MPNKSLKSKYIDLALAYFSEPEEQHLAAAAELGRELVLSGVHSEEVGEIHQQAFESIAKEFPNVPLNLAANLTSAPLLELLMAYGMAFREKVSTLEYSTKALGQSEERLRGILETVTEGIIAIDSKCRIQIFNPAAESIFGQKADDIIGRVFTNLIDDERISKTVKNICAAIENEREGPHVLGPLEVTGRKFDGTIFPIEMAITEMRLHNHHRVVCQVRDLTEHKLLQSQLFQASKMSSLGEMATGIAHELNQPINIIRMAAESSIEMLEEDGNMPRDKLIEKFNRIVTQMDRAATIIDHLRSFGRKPTETVEGIDLKQTVLGACEMMKGQMKLCGINILFEFPDEDPFVKAHPVQLEQVVLNLLSNARDAMEAHQQSDADIHLGDIILKIEADSESPDIKLIVEDDAGGFPETILDRIFEPFFTTKEIGKGTGLGLSISYGIVSEMGGSIKAENTDSGAKITVILPKYE